MAHCPSELLDDLADLFAELRTWPGVVEKAPAVFYAGREPFLHFHLEAGGTRRADVKGRTGWVAHSLPRPVSATRRQAFLRELGRRHAERLATARTARAAPPRPSRSDRAPAARDARGKGSSR